MKTIKDQWDSYLEEVIPQGTSPIQVWEIRRAFYAGVASLLEILMEDDVTPEHLEKLYQELMTFTNQVMRGAA